MIRRQARLRREYLYRKSLEDKKKTIQDKKDRLKSSLDNNQPIHTDLKRDALKLQKKLDWDDQGPQVAATLGDESGGAAGTHEDDEYRWAGVEDPKVGINPVILRIHTYQTWIALEQHPASKP